MGDLERVFDTFGVEMPGDLDIKIGFKYFGKIYALEYVDSVPVVTDVTAVSHRIVPIHNPSPIQEWLIQAAVLRITMPHYVITVNGKDIRPGIRILKPFKSTVEESS